MNLHTLETKTQTLIAKLEQQKALEQEIKQLKAEVFPEIKSTPQTEESKWRVQFKAFEILLSICPGRKSFDQKKAEEVFPQLKSDEFKKQGNPYELFNYTVKLPEVA